VQLKSPAVINAFGDFYDSLRPEQQAKLRESAEALARGRHGMADRCRAAAVPPCGPPCTACC
jgi:hypothetical protein